MDTINELLRKFETTRTFTEAEAWLLFRIAAITEACGWTLLIAGIITSRYITPHNSTALILAGRTHGMLFLLYLIAAFGLYPSLGWSRWRAIFALAFSVPPYGTLVFEQWVSAKRHNAGFKSYQQYLLYNVLTVSEM
jgi:integral membrane protein